MQQPQLVLLTTTAVPVLLTPARGTTSQLLSPGLQTKTEPSLFSKIKFPNKSNNVFGQQRISKKNDRDFIQSNKSENTMMLFDECVLIQNL